MFAPTFKESVSLLSSVVTTVERAQVDEGEYFTSTTGIEEKTEIIAEERTVRKEEVWRVPEIPTPQTVTEREDDWFVLLDVTPRETPYVPPGTARTPCAAFLSRSVPCFLAKYSRRVLLLVLKTLS